MNKITCFLLLLLFCLLPCRYGFSQMDTAKSKAVNITQMTVMVIPRANEDQDIRNVLDHSPCKRIAVAKIKEAFDKRGFKTIDFVARLNAAKTNNAFMTANARDFKSFIIQFSGTDLVVEADVIISEQSPTIRVASIPVQCYDASSGFSIGISTDGCKSPPNQADTVSLVSRALDGSCLTGFLSSLNEGFENMRTNGRPLKVNIAPSQSSKYNLLSKVGNAPVSISTIITSWLEDHTVKSNYVVNGKTRLLLDLDDVRIPLLDSKNKNYRAFMFGDDMVSFLDSKGISADSEVKNGTIYITIN